MRRENFHQILYISRVEFGRWFRSSRILILGVMLVFIHIQIITTLKQTAEWMGEPVSLFEGFIALGNSGVIVLIIPALWLVLMADFPQKEGIDLFYQIRTSKKIWTAGQILFSIKAVIFLTVFLLLSSMLLLSGSGVWKLAFSDAVTHYSARFPERTGDYILQLLPENLYQQMTLKTVLCHTTVLMMLYFLLLAEILLLAALCNRKKAGIGVDLLLIALGTVTTAANTKAMWLFPMAHSISWVHYEKYLNSPIFPMWGSYLYLGIGCAGLMAACLICSRSYEAGRK